jgi:sphingomyelin phosphodiesterase
MTTIKVFSWNIACMPNYLNIFGNIENRLENIIKFIEIHNPDIISLQEVFSQNVRKILYNFFTKKKYNVLMSPETTLLLNGGLFIASKYDIVAHDYKIYKNYIGEDGISQKGILYCLIKYNNKYINIFNSHLNSDTPLIYSNSKNIPIVKKNQLTEFLIYFNKIIKNNKYIICDKKNIIYVIAGDLNLDFNSNLYTYFIENLKKKLNICFNENEIITDSIEKKQVDYIINCYDKNLSIIPHEIIYSYSTILKLSDHCPLIKKFIL